EVEAALGPEGHAVLALVLNRREDAVAGLLARLPPGARETLDRLSPLPAVAPLRGRLLIPHRTADDSIPFTQSPELAGAGGPQAPLGLFRPFNHTGPQPLWPAITERTRDGWTLVRLADTLLPR